MTDTGLASVCYEYVLISLIDKEDALTYGRAKCSQAENLIRDTEKRKADSGQMQVSLRVNKTCRKSDNIMASWQYVD